MVGRNNSLAPAPPSSSLSNYHHHHQADHLLEPLVEADWSIAIMWACLCPPHFKSLQHIHDIYYRLMDRLRRVRERVEAAVDIR